MTIESRGSGQGTAVREGLPLASAPAAAHLRIEPIAVRPRRIVVVEDNVDARAALVALLELDGHSVSAAADGEAAVTLILESDPDVAFFDVGLPMLDGYEVARRLRPGGARTFLVAFTGYGQETDKRRARDAGFDLHLVQPVDADKLAQTIARVPAQA